LIHKLTNDWLFNNIYVNCLISGQNLIWKFRLQRNNTYWELSQSQVCQILTISTHLGTFRRFSYAHISYNKYSKPFLWLFIRCSRYGGRKFYDILRNCWKDIVIRFKGHKNNQFCQECDFKWWHKCYFV
jgi:hypothetical protein